MNIGSNKNKKLTLRMLPPATPPLISPTSDPGLLTSKDLITIIFRSWCEISLRNGDLRDQILANHINVVFQLCRYWHYWRFLSNRHLLIGKIIKEVSSWTPHEKQTFKANINQKCKDGRANDLNELFIASCWLITTLSWVRSTLFWRIIMLERRIISTAARCSDVLRLGAAFTASYQK